MLKLRSLRLGFVNRTKKRSIVGKTLVAAVSVMLLAGCVGFGWRPLGPGDHSNNYDTEVRYGKEGRKDWPVTLIFYGNATVAKVRNSLWSLNLGGTCDCHSTYMRVDDGYGALWDSEQGNKYHQESGTCFFGRWHTSYHIRFFADQGDKFTAPSYWGNYVIATAHRDIREGCDGGSFGYPEQAENFYAYRYATAGFTVYQDYWNMNNPESGTRYNSGSATLIQLP